jgi:AAA15 family ATPase/GTPase
MLIRVYVRGFLGYRHAGKVLHCIVGDVLHVGTSRRVKITRIAGRNAYGETV